VPTSIGGVAAGGRVLAPQNCTDRGIFARRARPPIRGSASYQADGTDRYATCREVERSAFAGPEGARRCDHGQCEAFEDCQASCDGLGFCDYDSFDLAVCVCE